MLVGNRVGRDFETKLGVCKFYIVALYECLHIATIQKKLVDSIMCMYV